MYLYSFCQQRSIVRAGRATKKLASSKYIHIPVFHSHILMTALILHKDGRRPMDPNAQDGGEGKGLCPQPKEEVHAELHETAPPTRAPIQTRSVITSLWPQLIHSP